MPTKIISANTTGTYIGDYTSVSDTALQETSATTNFNADLTFETTKYAVNNHTHTLIRFSGLSNITGPVTVTSVTLGLYLSDRSGDNDVISVRRLLRTWDTTQATWTVYTTGNNWTTAGALGAATDRTDTASGTLSTGTGTGVWVDVTQTSGGLLDNVEAWINGTYANDGWHLARSDAADDAHYRVWASSNGTDGNRPYLSVTYTEGGGPVTNLWAQSVM